MKSAEEFWRVIGAFNSGTILIQIILTAGLALSISVAFKGILPRLPKLMLSAAFLFIGIVFFLVYDRSPTAYFFGFPLYAVTGVLFLIDALRHPSDAFRGFSPVSGVLLAITLLYPLVSFLLGHRYPAIVLYLLPVRSSVSAS